MKLRLVPCDLPCKTLVSRALPDPDKSRKTTTPTVLRQQGGQAHKHRYSNLNLLCKNNCSLRATQTLTSNLTASTNTRYNTKDNQTCVKPEAAKTLLRRKPLPLPELLQANTVKTA